MPCKFCNEKDDSKLAMRSTVVNGKVETVQICTSCLWGKLTNDAIEDGNVLSEKADTEGISPESKAAYSPMGKKTG